MEADFLSKLEMLRALVNKPLNLSSAYRCPVHNRKVSSSGLTGPHTTGRAVDIRASGSLAWTILKHATALGFQGIGISQKGPHKLRFIHLDDLIYSVNRPRPWVFSY